MHSPVGFCYCQVFESMMGNLRWAARWHFIAFIAFIDSLTLRCHVVDEVLLQPINDYQFYCVMGRTMRWFLLQKVRGKPWQANKVQKLRLLTCCKVQDQLIWHHFASQDGHFTAAVPQGFCDIQRAESLKSVDEWCISLYQCDFARQFVRRRENQLRIFKAWN